MQGYSVSGECLNLLGSLHGRHAIICGSAETVFDDFNRAPKGAVVFAVNDVGMYLPTVDHWVSRHPKKLRHWANARRLDGSLGQDFVTHTVFSMEASADYVWHIEPCTFPLSGYFAMQLAYIMGAALIVLCGCTGDGTRRFFDHLPRSEYQYGGGESFGDKRDRHALESEMKRVPEMKKRVRSLSGWTKTFFGGLD